MFRKEEFFEAFAQHGLLVDANYVPEIGAPVPFKAGFISPTELVLGDAVQTDEFSIEYERVGSPALEEGSQLTIAGETYRVREAPRRRGDGSFMFALLTRVVS